MPLLSTKSRGHPGRRRAGRAHAAASSRLRRPYSAVYFPISQLQWGKSALSPADNRDDLTGGVQGARSPTCTLHRCAVPGGTWVTRAAERPAPGDPRLRQKLTVLSHLTSQYTPRPRGRGCPGHTRRTFFENLLKSPVIDNIYGTSGCVPGSILAVLRRQASLSPAAVGRRPGGWSGSPRCARVQGRPQSTTPEGPRARPRRGHTHTPTQA